MDENIYSAVKYANIPLPQKPRLTPWIQFVELSDDQIQFRGSEFVFTIRYPLFIEVFHRIKLLLDGNHTVEDISSTVGPHFLPTTVVFLLKMLRANGLLQEGSSSLRPSESQLSPEAYELQFQFFSHFLQNPQGAIALMNDARVGVLGDEQLKADIIDHLSKLGLGHIKDFGVPQKGNLEYDLKGIDILIACKESSGFSFFDKVNNLCLSSGARWLHVAIEGSTAFLGPTIVPKQTACYECYDRRRNSNRADLESFLAYKEVIENESSDLSEGFLQPFWSLISSQVSLEITRIISGFAPPNTIGSFYEFNPQTPNSVKHEVFRVPNCPACNPRKPKLETWDTANATSKE